MPTQPQSAPAPVCPHCGSGDLVANVPVVSSIETGGCGLHYKACGPLCGTEPLLADLCRTCGTVCRFRVRRTDRRWLTRSP